MEHRHVDVLVAGITVPNESDLFSSRINGRHFLFTGQICNGLDKKWRRTVFCASQEQPHNRDHRNRGDRHDPNHHAWKTALWLLLHFDRQQNRARRRTGANKPRNVCAFGKLNADRIAGTQTLIILVELGAQTPGFIPHDGVGLGVVVRATVEYVGSDALKLLPTTPSLHLFVVLCEVLHVSQEPRDHTGPRRTDRTAA